MKRSLRPCRLALPLAALLGLVVVLLAAFRGEASESCSPRPIGPGEVRAHLAFLADDLLEGRGTGTRGGHLAEAYVEAVFRQNGLVPAFGESFRQEIELRRIGPDPGMKLSFARAGEAGGAGVDLDAGASGTGFVGAFPRPETKGRLDAELVFAGYGIDAPPWSWDDFKGIDLAGKVVVVLSGEPGGNDPALFEGKALTWFGRWTTKLETAARKGAAGALIVHETEGATYGWEVVRNGWARGRVVDPGRADLLSLEGWLAEGTAERLFALAGKDLASLRAAASRRDFRPVPLGVRLSAFSNATYETVRTANVAGVVRGRRPAGEASVVVVSAHHDHLGIGHMEKGDAIYNGAVDNGSALAAMLSLSRLLAEGERKAVDVLFLAAAAEEEGLLGSAFFVRNPPVPLRRLVADLNFEMSAVWGEARDVAAIGARHSDLSDVVAKVARANGLEVAPEPNAEKGFFFRSDQFPFAKAGVPSAWVDLGDDLVGRAAGEGKRLRDEYLAKRYHHPDDAFDPAWELTGTAQLARFVAGMIDEIARRGGRVDWKPGAPFRR